MTLVDFISDIGPDWFSNQYFNNTVAQYLAALVIFTLVALAARILEKVIISRIHSITTNTTNQWDDMISDSLEKLNWRFYAVIGLVAAIQTLNLATFLQRSIFVLTVVVITSSLLSALSNLLRQTIEYSLKGKNGKNKIDPSFISILVIFIQFLIWFTAFIIILQHLGINVTALVGGLGIGGIAIAFALQEVLSELFSSFAIYLDKPFKTGDFIKVNNTLGEVKHIGIKSTRITSLSGEEIVVPNQDINSAYIQNFKKMPRRRVEFSFGVTYSTTPIQLEKINQIIIDIYDSLQDATLDRTHFFSFGDFSLNFVVVYYVETSDFNVYMDIQQDVNLRLMKALEKEKIEFAFPTQTIHLADQKLS